MKAVCPVCMHHCGIGEGKIGLWRARGNKNGTSNRLNYGKIASYAVDPIEKKPLMRFYPGSKILSVGSYGCNLSCTFCQNHMISMVKESETSYGVLSPEELIEDALQCRNKGNIGIAYTYNEPLIGYEYVRDCAILAKEKGLKNVVITNGCVEPHILEEILPFIDAFNIDLKGFTEGFYKKIGGNLELVKAFIRRASMESHIEVTTLVIPDENDNKQEIREAAKWLASINADIPYHISRFFPQWKMLDKKATEVRLIYDLVEEAKTYLKYVYAGNC